MIFWGSASEHTWPLQEVILFVSGFNQQTRSLRHSECWKLMWAAAAANSLQSCPTLCDPIDCSPLGSTIPGILQARTLEWVAISFSNAWKGKVKVKSLCHVWLFGTSWTAAYQASPSLGFSRQEYWNGLPLPSPADVGSSFNCSLPSDICTFLERQKQQRPYTRGTTILWLPENKMKEASLALRNDQPCNLQGSKQQENTRSFVQKLWRVST